MFAPIAVDNIAFPQRTSLSTLDFIPESFEAWNAYGNAQTSSTYTTQSFETSINNIYRYGINGDGKILGINEGGGVPFIWDTNTNTSSSFGSVSVGTIRNVVWDNLTNSWVICGTNAFVKVNCDTLVTASIAVPTNVGTQYPSVVAYGGKAYGLPLVSTTADTGVAIFDLVANTATTSSVKVGGTGGFWGACLNSIGTIYFFKEEGGTNNSIFEYNPTTTSGSLFGTIAETIGYLNTNLPDGSVFINGYDTGGNIYILNPVNKQITSFAEGEFKALTGLCVGQNGNVFGIYSNGADNPVNGIYCFNPKNRTMFNSGFALQKPTADKRGFQDMFSLGDGRLILMPGQLNSGRLVYYTYLANPNNNTFGNIGAGNPIMTNGKGV